MVSTTADRVLEALHAYTLKQERPGQYRCNSPLRPDSNSHAFTLTVTNGEHGAWIDHVSGEGGSLYDLAQRLGLHVGNAPRQPIDSKVAYDDLAAYATAKGVDRAVFTAAGWQDAVLVRNGGKQRSALPFVTDSGIKYRFIDGDKPTFKPKERGYEACWYKLPEAVALADERGQPLVICNGEPSTVVAQHFGVAAAAVTSGENKTIMPAWIDALQAVYDGPIVVALDCDAAGRAGAEKWRDALVEAGYDVRALDLNGGTGFDLADFCRLHGNESAASLRQLRDLGRDELNEPAPLAAAVTVPALPNYAAVDDALAATASPWLDTYIDFSRRWSPESYDDFHEAIALWVLSTVAARRVAVDFGKTQYTPLYIALCARSTIYAKSTAAEIGRDLLEACGLLHLLAADDATPQAFLRGMTLRVPPDFGKLDEIKRAKIEQKLQFAAQKGWYYDEFGQKLNAMMQSAGTMADYRGHLRRLNECLPSYTYVTVGRGEDEIERPYLALLASLTPADLRPHARKGAALWGDGLLARFALVAPPADLYIPSQDFPDGERIFPLHLVRQLRRWHEALGLPRVSLVEQCNEKDEPTGFYDVRVDTPPAQKCSFGAGVRDAMRAYRRALRDITQRESDMEDIAGNYMRFPEKALRIAMLLASLEHEGRIELRHWMRAQQITERWRVNLHTVIAQLDGGEPSKERATEDRLVRVLQRFDSWTTASRVQPYLKHMSSAEVADGLHKLAAAGVIESRQDTRATKYRARQQRRAAPNEAYCTSALTALTALDTLDGKKIRQDADMDTLQGANMPRRSAASAETDTRNERSEVQQVQNRGDAPRTDADIAQNGTQSQPSSTSAESAVSAEVQYAPTGGEGTNVAPRLDMAYVRKMWALGNTQAIKVHCTLKRVPYDDAIRALEGAA